MARPAAPAESVLAIAPAHAAGLIGGMVAGALLTLALLMLLPVNHYYQWQQGDGTILARSRWIYERIHFDPTPIDVAMIGSSRMEASARTRELSEILSARLRRPVRVVNFGLPQEGRNLHWVLTKELLENRPEVKLIVLSGGSPAMNSHPGFRFLGDDASVLGSPLIYNNSYAEDAFTVSYRHLAYFVQGLWPWAFQLSQRFDPAIYRARGFDPTQSFTLNGDLVDRDKTLDFAKAAKDRAAMGEMFGVDPKLLYLPLDQRYAIERHFVRRIHALAREKRVKVAFLWVPVYSGSNEAVADAAFYEPIGPIIHAAQLGADPSDYMDLGHLNRRGTRRLLPWLADRLEPLVRDAEKR